MDVAAFQTEQTGTTAFALIGNEKRLWGADCDSLRGWHVHPLGDPDQHRAATPMTPRDVVESVSDIWGRLP